MTGIKFVLISITVSFLATKVSGNKNPQVPFVGAHNKLNLTAAKKSSDIRKELLQKQYNVTIEPMANVSVTTGEYAKFDCNITGDTSKLYILQATWSNETTFLFVNKVDLIENPRFSVTKKKEFSQLTISNVQPQDQGWYKCELNTYPMTIGKVYLEVLKPKNDTATPKTISRSTNSSNNGSTSSTTTDVTTKMTTEMTTKMTNEMTTKMTTEMTTKMTSEKTTKGTTQMTITATTNKTDMSTNNIKPSSQIETINKNNSTLVTEKKSTRQFDGWSFIGGIILTIGISAIAIIGIKYYKAKTRTTNLNYSLMFE